jgi:ABC-type Fe3+ transport system permease subunit
MEYIIGIYIWGFVVSGLAVAVARDDFGFDKITGTAMFWPIIIPVMILAKALDRP